MKNYIEISYAELVNDITDIYWDHILPIGRFSISAGKVTGRYVRPGFQVSSIFIDRESEPYEPFRKILKKYQFLAPHLLVIAVDPGAISPIHIDGGDPGKRRPISLNIPIQGCDSTCKTEFFDIPPEGFWQCGITSTRWVKEGIETPKVDEYTLINNPIVMNPQIPHRVNNLNGSSHRLTVNWSADLKWKFTDAVNFFEAEKKIILN